jgi:hypothetical protein
MKEELFKYLQTNTGALSLKDIVVGFIVSIIIGMIIYVSYRFSHSAAVYSKKFNVSLVMITLVTTMVMTVIGDNVALSLGMVGALSIVRFRTAIKDSRDTAYIFWCVAAGISCGVQDYTVAGIGSGIIFLVMLILGNTNNNDRYLLIVRGNSSAVADVKLTIKDYYNGKARFCVENVNQEKLEEIYEISETLMNMADGKNIKPIREQLFAIKGVESVNLVCQNDEINR